MIKELFSFGDFFVNTFSKLPNNFKDPIGEVVFYRTYSRNNETWAQCILRVVTGNISIRKNYLKNAYLPYNDKEWQEIGEKICNAMYNFKMLPAGRNLYASGTDIMYKNGCLPINNCAFLKIDSGKEFINVVTSTFMFLANGEGIGIDIRYDGKFQIFDNLGLTDKYIIEDSREGWSKSIELAISYYIFKGSPKYIFDYSKIRPKGSIIKGTGGLASGPESLKILHGQFDEYFRKYKEYIKFASNDYTQTRLFADIFNSIGACVISGASRRSAILLLGDPNDKIFLDLKNYNKYPERINIGYMSNNSVILSKSEDFLMLPSITERIFDNSEPGIINMINIKKYGRYGKDRSEINKEICGVNACSEACLEPYELCNLVTTFPVNCKDLDEWVAISELAAIFASNVSLLPTNSTGMERTNAVIAKNHKIGVGIGGLAVLFDTIEVTKLIKYFKLAYKSIESININLAKTSGIRPSTSLTAIAPNGTISLLAGQLPGIHYAIYQYYIRRIRIAKNDPLVTHLKSCNVPFGDSQFEPDVHIFEFPMKNPAVRCSSDISVLEQLNLAALMQECYVDQSISISVYFDKDRDTPKDIVKALGLTIPRLKTVSLASRFKPNKEYKNLPIEEITKEEFMKRKHSIRFRSVNMKVFSSVEEMFCTNDSCK